MSRAVAWWSAGAASATAAYMALQQRPETIVAYCDTSSAEHPDNMRFKRDCEAWYGKPIVVLRSDKYVDTWDVYERTRYLVGVNGARCTTELKKLVRRAYQQDGDVQVFGFTEEEAHRAHDFIRNNPETTPWFPLIANGIKHADCLAVLREVGIELPAMYRLGYKNNNCIGCVKGQTGYWNKIRVDFPAVFARMAALERKLDVAINKREPTVDGKRLRLRVFLDELDPDAGDYKSEAEVQCGVACEAVFTGCRV